MLRLLVTQARGVDRYDSPIDYLEDSLIYFFASINVELYPVPNCVDNIERFIQGIDYSGLVISGGGDVHHKHLNGIENKTNRYSFKRDNIETSLINICQIKKKKILGICHGMQKLNTHYGGKISTHYKKQNIEGMKPNSNHTIRILAPYFNMNGEYQVNQFHENTIEHDDLAEDLNVFATGLPDENVEAFVHNLYPILGIQWHPDRISPDPQFNRELISRFFGKS